ncbi:ATP-dependent zinc metalloprotease FtsH [Noviherbaspirillum malthae]|uniref:ATP-dependent zinc metalloprotease FtsH n=1 Tax=Noviherbaspirillum malthae TaxID=1260987 RepID=UPI0018907F53|nr:ATP-dependent zinc metalloprotease FtsH [Noviherbaspirillum malthae]
MDKKKRAESAPNAFRLPFWYWLLIPAAIWLAQIVADASRTNLLAYSEFKQLLHAGRITDARLAQDTITGMLKPDQLEAVLGGEAAKRLKCPPQGQCHFQTVRVADPSLVQELEASNVHFLGELKTDWVGYLLTWVIPLLLLYLMFKGAGGRSGISPGSLFGIGKSTARVYAQSTTGVSFEDIAGIDEAKGELMEIVEFLKNPDRYRRLGGKIPKGVLIVGAPGTGKTLLAKAVAGEAGVPFFSISGSEFVEMFVGVGAARVRDLFAQAAEKAPAIIFIDELDALGRARGVGGALSGYNEQEQTLNQLLVEMDGFDTNNGVIILAATNRPEILDPALLRPGRFDRHIALDRPDLKGRQQILVVHTKKVKLATGVDLEEIAARTAGFAGAELANLVNEAALLAARQGKASVEQGDFDEAIDRLVAGLERKTRVMSPVEKRTVAYHEAGHALIAESRGHADRVAKVSIIPRGIGALGYTQQQPTEDRYLMTKSELLDRLDVFLGGRVAEEIAIGDLSTGAQNDLQLATDTARHMVTQYGMSDSLGLATFEAPSAASSTYPGMPGEGKPYSELTSQTIDAEIIRLLEAAHARVRETLTARRSLLDTLAQALMERETLDRQALNLLLKGRGDTIRRVQ